MRRPVTVVGATPALLICQLYERTWGFASLWGTAAGVARGGEETVGVDFRFRAGHIRLVSVGRRRLAEVHVVVQAEIMSPAAW